jgi:hypothetical protein
LGHEALSQADAGGGGGFAAHLTKDGAVVKVDALAKLARLVPVPKGEGHADPLVLDAGQGDNRLEEG